MPVRIPLRRPPGLAGLVAGTMLCLLAAPAAVHSSGGSVEEARSSGRPLITNLWVDTPLSQVLRDISMQGKVVVALDPAVTDAQISLEVQDMPVERCLPFVLSAQGLVARKVNEGFYVVGNGRPGTPTFDRMATSAALELNYVTAKHLLDSMPKDLREYMTHGNRTTQVVTYAPPEKMRRIREIVEQIDVPRRQVILEALVVELSREKSRTLGVSWSASAADDDLFTGMVRYTSVDKGSFEKLIYNLDMMVNKGEATIRSRPRVATVNGEQAVIDVSLEEFFSITKDVNASYLRTELQAVKSGVALKMTPQIGSRDDITVAVLTEVSDVVGRPSSAAKTGGAESVLVVRRRKAETTVNVRDGDAIVIGGLVESQERKDVRSVPYLSSLPAIGGLFRKTTTVSVEREVMIFITPRVVDGGASARVAGDRPDAVKSEGARAGSCEREPPAGARAIDKDKSVTGERGGLERLVTLSAERSRRMRESMNAGENASLHARFQEQSGGVSATR